MFLVIGGTGTTGREVVKALAATNERVRVMVRGDGAALRSIAPNIETIEGDLAKPASLDRAFENVTRAYVLVANHPRMVDWSSNAVTAARNAGVKHFVRHSVLGADENARPAFLRWHAHADADVARSGIAHTILRPNVFMQNLPNAYGASIKAAGIMSAPQGENTKVSWIDVRDIAALAAKVMTSSGHDGRTYELTGSESLSYTDVARLVSEAIGKDVRYVKADAEQWKTQLMSYGLEEWFLDDLIALCATYDAGVGKNPTNVVRELVGEAPRTMRSYVAEWAPSLHG